MPELPEVETIRRGLKDCILNKKIVQVEVCCEKSFVGDVSEVVGQKVVDLRRRGKALLIDLSGGVTLMVHLRMTGQLLWWDSSLRKEESQREETSKISKSKSAVSDLEIEHIPSFAGGHPDDSFVSSLPNKQTRVIIEMDEGVLYFNDQRKFGFIKILSTDEVERDAFIASLGAEPWEMLPGEFYAALQRHAKAPVKAVILDQKVIAGLGNIYADEALYDSMIHPERKAGSLSAREAERLLRSACKVMERSLEAGGSTIQNYVKADGTRGNYLDLFAKVYHKDGGRCERCGCEIIKTRVAGRGTHYCPGCQELPGVGDD